MLRGGIREGLWALTTINDSFRNGMNSKYYSAVKNLINNLDMESTDAYIRLKIFIITKQITL